MLASKRTIIAGTLGAAVALVAVGTAAWACTYRPSIVAPAAQAGRPGSEVTVRGEGAVPGGPVEVRWNALDGQRMAAVTADNRGAFAAAVTVPQVAPGMYFFAVDTGAGIARSAFQVTAEAEASTPSARAGARPSWTAGERPVAQPDGSSNGFAIGAALLAGGVVVLFSGFTVAAIRSRRARSTLVG